MGTALPRNARIDLLRKIGERQRAIELLCKLADDHPGSVIALHQTPHKILLFGHFP